MNYSKIIKLYKEVEDSLDPIGEISYVDHMGSDMSIVRAARVSYGKSPGELLAKKDEKLIKYLLKNHHTSPFEHCSCTIRAMVPIFVVRQWQRHRTQSYSEISMRYSSNNLCFYEPKLFRKQLDGHNKQSSEKDWHEPDMSKYSSQSAYRLVCEHRERAVELYLALLEAGVAREMARMVLPQNLYTEFYATANLLNWMRFLDLRLPENAQWEIRRAAGAVREILIDLYPIAMGIKYTQ